MMQSDFGGFRTRSSSSVTGIPSAQMNSKAAEAELINRATQTAIVAARSILMSGGSEEVALKTAKAAAESVLNPMMSDTDTLSGRSSLGSAFGGRRRKAKRQAEVVASMALMSATTGIRPNGSGGMAEWDSIGAHNNPFGRNVITIRQDEPSVLSGSISTRPPRMPTPKSQVSQATTVQKRSSSSTYKLSTPPTSASADMSPRAFGRNSQSESIATSAMSFSKPSPPVNSSPPPCPAKESPKDENKDKASKYESQSNFLDKILNMKVGDSNINTTKEDKIKVSAMLRDMESDSVNQSGTMDSDRQSSMASSLADDETADTSTVDTANQHRADKEKPWSLDPLIVQMTGALNIFTCGPLGTFMNGQAADDMEDMETIGSANNSAAKRPKRDRHVASAVVESRDDTFDDNTTNYTCDDTEVTERDARVDREDAGNDDDDDDDDDIHSNFRDPDFGVIDSRSTDSSTNLLRELVMSDISEGAIQVRSSIRETMEKIVSKSNRGRTRGNRTGDSDPDKTWLSYELRQKDDGAEKLTSSLHHGSKSKKASTSRRTPKASKEPKPSKVSKDSSKVSKANKASKGSKGLKKKSPSFFFKNNKK
jgi:hypothetical protein